MAKRLSIKPPKLPAELRKQSFAPSLEWEEWIRETFIDGDGRLVNWEHEHLSQALLGVVFSRVKAKKKGVRLLGTCEMVQQSAGSWPSGQRLQQLREWFGEVPHFVITLDAQFVAEADAIGICALVEHELYHAGAACYEDGSPIYDHETGAPSFRLRPHDVEAFTGEVRRYGAWSPALKEMEQAFALPALFRGLTLGGACGCGAKL